MDGSLTGYVKGSVHIPGRLSFSLPLFFVVSSNTNNRHRNMRQLNRLILLFGTKQWYFPDWKKRMKWKCKKEGIPIAFNKKERKIKRSHMREWENIAKCRCECNWALLKIILSCHCTGSLTSNKPTQYSYNVNITTLYNGERTIKCVPGNMSVTDVHCEKVLDSRFLAKCNIKSLFPYSCVVI